ncbi:MULTISPECIES: hypothetical protein, partial [unclassified Pseudoalteromonas]
MIDLLNQLQQKNIQLSSDSGTLKVKAPKGAMTAELAEQVKTHKEQLLHFLERKQQGRSVASIPLCAIDRSGAIPASFSQQRLWLIDKLEGSQHYNVAAALACDGVLDIAAIEASLTQ